MHIFRVVSIPLSSLSKSFFRAMLWILGEFLTVNNYYQKNALNLSLLLTEKEKNVYPFKSIFRVLILISTAKKVVEIAVLKYNRSQLQ